MSEITTAAELDALPEGTTVLDGDHDIMTKGADGQWHLRSENDEPAPCHLPAMVLVRPDRPAQPTVQPSVEAVAEVLNVHRWQTMGVTSVQCECGEIWRERNAAIERLRQASLAMAVALDTGRVDHNGHPDNEGEPDCGGCWWETVERIHKIIGGEQP